MGEVDELQRLFRAVAGIKVDKEDLRRYRAFVDEKVDDLAIAGRNSASWNDRDVIAPQDLPITKGLQERMREFDHLDEADGVRALLSRTVRRPPDDVTFSEDAEDLLTEVFGGLSVALARSFRILDERVTNPSSQHWERAFELFRLTL